MGSTHLEDRTTSWAAENTGICQLGAGPPFARVSFRLSEALLLLRAVDGAGLPGSSRLPPPWVLLPPGMGFRQHVQKEAAHPPSSSCSFPCLLASLFLLVPSRQGRISVSKL